MSYIIRNYGNTRDLPFKGGTITMVREQAIVTDDVEMVNALTGFPGIHIGKQPGTADAPVPAPPKAEPIPDMSMTKKELLALVKEQGLEVPENATKKDLVELLDAATAPKVEEPKDDDGDEDEDEAGFEVGNRVTVKIDGDFYTGEIKELDEEKATVTFDDGDELSIDLDELQLVEGKDEEKDEEEE